jgi:uncharacterized protein YicC (UPF0701 family)
MTTNYSKRNFELKILGRTLEHLGVQMYKQRGPAIAELVANCWDAGATEVSITLPASSAYDNTDSEIKIYDNGNGMEPNHVQDKYMIIGRNRRRSGENISNNRRVMGRKGIGKLAGFGIASEMSVFTWANNVSTEISLDSDLLKTNDNEIRNVPIVGKIAEAPVDKGASGTIITLKRLKHKTPISSDDLQQFLARRFSRTIRGEMKILINGTELCEPIIDFESREPRDGDFTEVTLSDGKIVKYFYGFSKTVIPTKEMQGFTVYVRGKTAQAPPFFFNVETTASGQHGTKYLTGTIEADFLDEGIDDNSDIISTDRQGIEWDSSQVEALRIWGEALVRKALRERIENRGSRAIAWVLQEASFQERIQRLEKASQTQLNRFLKSLGEVSDERENTLRLADMIIKSFEFQHFHDVLSDLEKVADDPQRFQDLLEHLSEWRTLESRAILEIINGRLEILEKCWKMIMDDAPETAHRKGDDNMHDLLAGYPWIINPEWQTLAEEKAISTQLYEWHCEDVKEEDARLRYDFLGLKDDSQLVVIEIKRAGHPVEFQELQRLETYSEKLCKAHNGPVFMALIYGGTLDISDNAKKAWQERSDAFLWPWSFVYERCKKHYGHYKALLESNITDKDFEKKKSEILQTRRILDSGTVWRGEQEREKGLGPQDVS